MTGEPAHIVSVQTEWFKRFSRVKGYSEDEYAYLVTRSDGTSYRTECLNPELNAFFAAQSIPNSNLIAAE